MERFCAVFDRNASVRRYPWYVCRNVEILRVAEFSGRLDNPEEKPEESNNLAEDQALIRKAGSEGMVLLKNNEVLPLQKEKIK